LKTEITATEFQYIISTMKLDCRKEHPYIYYKVQTDKLYTTIGIIMLLSSCADNGELSIEQKQKIMEKEIQEKLSEKNTAKHLNRAKAMFRDSINYVSDIYVSVVKDTVKH
jgi:hypothetical protein